MRYLAAVLLLWSGAQAQIAVAPATAAFGTLVQGQSIPMRSVTVTSSEPWRAASGANWLTTTPQTGQASTNPVTVTFSIVTTNLPVRETEQTTTVVFSSTATGGSPAPPVSVTVTITFKPVVSVSRTSFTYNALPGQPPPVESFASPPTIRTTPPGRSLRPWLRREEEPG